MKRKRKILLILLAVLLLLILPGFYNALAIRRYTVEAPGIALITDLHTCAYGAGQRELPDAIGKAMKAPRKPLRAEKKAAPGRLLFMILSDRG